MIGQRESLEIGFDGLPTPLALDWSEHEQRMNHSFSEALDDAMKRGYVAAFRWLGSHDEAREACQEAAARTLAAKRRYDPTRSFYAWFYRILKNHCLDRLKSRTRITESVESPEAVERSATDESAELLVMRSERHAAVAAAIEQLPGDLREIIELRHFQDLSYREMGEVLGCPEGTVMSRLYRARRHLRELLADDLAPLRAPSTTRRSS